MLVALWEIFLHLLKLHLNTDDYLVINYVTLK